MYQIGIFRPAFQTPGRAVSHPDSVFYVIKQEGGYRQTLTVPAWV